ncbi:hypothetical protein [Enterobacter hormaechei]|uniref:hypothetical protein n=1 Tax=Enterobacter hormaechei TaxID=158836 RepID=UPI0012B83660|nr:hypothetical protein [Enterobacter hormaechei]
MSNIDKQAQKELYAKVEQQAHSLRGSPREYQALTGLCPVNVIEMHAQKIQALLDELEAKDKLIAELEFKLEAADKLQDSAFRHGLQHGFSYGQTDNQAGFEQAIQAYGQQWKGE